MKNDTTEPLTYDREHIAAMLRVPVHTLPETIKSEPEETTPRKAERPRLSDAEWDVVRPLLPPPEKCRSAVDERHFVEVCLYAARVGLMWSYLRLDPGLETEACRKKLSRYSVHRDGSIWTRVYEGVRGLVTPENEALFKSLSERSEAERRRVFEYRRSRLEAILTG